MSGDGTVTTVRETTSSTPAVAVDASEAREPTAALSRGGGRSRSGPMLWALRVTGLSLTAAGAWAPARADANPEKRLLLVQTGQAPAVLSTAILGIQQPL